MSPRRLALFLAFLWPTAAHADDARRSVGVGFGLLQPIVLGGGNVEADFRWDWLVVSYSHGWSLQIPTTGPMERQHLREHVSFTTGLGIGPQLGFSSIGLFLDLRAELKLHHFDVSLEDRTGKSERALVEYDTVTAGAGLYATLLPFAHQRGPIRGLNASLSVRVWPRVWSSLEDDRLRYFNETTGREEVHEAADIGFADTPVIVNLALGYLFAL